VKPECRDHGVSAAPAIRDYRSTRFTLVPCAAGDVRRKHDAPGAKSLRGSPKFQSFSVTFLYHKSVFICVHVNVQCVQERDEGVKGRHNSPGDKITMGLRNDCGGAEKSQQCHKYFLQHSTFASERPQVRTWGAPNFTLPWAPSNFVTPPVPGTAPSTV